MERRPNPPGWVPPKAPYNPYDPTDRRPPEGYPSEFATPGAARTWSEIPKEASDYKKIRNQMKKMRYTPRPPSDLYPGQFKILRRLPVNQRFNKGASIFGTILTTTVVTYCVFFKRWDDGYDNIFSPFYRWRLRMKETMGGVLTDQQREDLIPKDRPTSVKLVDNPQLSDSGMNEGDYALERPARKHIMEAEGITQQREVEMLKSLDIAQAQGVATAPAVTREEKKRKKWFGIF